MTTDDGLKAPELAPPPHALAPLEPRPGAALREGPSGVDLLAPVPTRRARRGVARVLASPLGWPIIVYSASRLLLFVVAGVVAAMGHRSFDSGFFLFDGQWYLRLAAHGYPTRALRTQSTLGFLPLYPLTVRAVAWASPLSLRVAALVTSFAGGLVATLLAQRLATQWWGQVVGSRAALVFALFPGSIVFSMAYSEGLTIPLALGCLLALRSGRWWVAGVLAGFASAVEPIALVLVVVCAGAAARELRRRGWRDPVALRSIAAPLLAPMGIGAFAVFLWAWTGTPFASYFAQHYGWHQQNEPLALLALPVARHLLGHPRELLANLLVWNVWNGLAGGVFLATSIVALARLRRELTSGALLLTACVAAVTLWSVLTPPNARMVMVAFPAVIVWARRITGRRFGLYVVAEVAFLVVASGLTFSGHMLP